MIAWRDTSYCKLRSMVAFTLQSYRYTKEPKETSTLKVTCALLTLANHKAFSQLPHPLRRSHVAHISSLPWKDLRYLLTAQDKLRRVYETSSLAFEFNTCHIFMYIYNTALSFDSIDPFILKLLYVRGKTNLQNYLFPTQKSDWKKLKNVHSNVYLLIKNI